MSTTIYNSFWEDLFRAAYSLEDTFYVLLVGASYVPDKDAHSKRSDVSDEVAGTGYVSGGKAITFTISRDDALDQIKALPSTVTWATATITARGAVIYRRRGGLASADELVAHCDFGGPVSSTNGDFTLSFTSPILVQN